LQAFHFISGELTNEHRLLLACARKDLTAQELAEIRSAIAAGIDWELLCCHSSSPLVYWHLQRDFPGVVPAEQDRRLKSLCEQNVRRNLLLTGVLLKILKALSAVGIRTLAYKGPTLAMALYGTLALRRTSDLDVMIDRASFPAAREVLTGLGYRPAFALTRKQDDARLRSDCEYEFSSCDGNVCLDVHWQIAAPHLSTQFNFDELWQRRRTLMLGRESIVTFSAEDNVIVLAVHGGKHLWQQLTWLVDFAECLRQDLDWQALRLRARSAHAVRLLFLSLALAHEVLRVPLPRDLAATIGNDDGVQTIAAAIARKLFVPTNETDQDASRWLTLLQVADSPWDCMRSAARFALSSGPREWQAVRLPDSLFAFYPLVRIAGMLRRAPSLLFSRAPAPAEVRDRMQKI
jgi:Uncharacterised nucleotidyltransferase